jgi:hypothetical protein
MRAGATGVSTSSPHNLVLGFENEAPRGSTCAIDADVDAVLTAGSVSVTSSFDAAPADIPGHTTNDRSAVIFLTWRNWCASGRVTATTTFGDGTTVVHHLETDSDTPGCNDPGAPAQLAITRAGTADVAEGSPGQTAQH